MTTVSKPKVLFVSQQCPWPKNSGGNIRTYFIAKHLTRIADITLLCAKPESKDREAREELEKFCAEVIFVDDPKSTATASRLGTLMRSFVRGRPAFIEHNWSPHLARAVDVLVSSRSFAWYHLNQVDTFPYFDERPELPLVLDTHNLHWEYYERRSTHASNPVMSVLYGRDGRLLKRYEHTAFRRSRSVLVCSEDEYHKVKTLDPTVNVAVVPNGVDCEEYRPLDGNAFDNEPEIIFVGDMAYAPNHEGVFEFINEVLPTIHESVPNARLTVVGKSPDVSLIEATKDRQDVEVTGFVDDVAPYLDRAKVFIVPLRFGAGTRLKVPQAFASGLPTVATTIGAEGIAYKHGEDILIADDNADMARAICSLLSGRDTYNSMRKKCRQTALSQYDWNVVGQQLIAESQQMLPS